MRLTKNDFAAKATQIQLEISAQLYKDVAARGNKHLPDKHVSDVFHMAIRFYLEEAYNEGIEFANNDAQRKLFKKKQI